jgi:pyruvate kinase
VRHTKIVATLGPASRQAQTIEALVAAGVDVFRLNFSHGTQSDHAGLFHLVREAARAAGRHVAVLQDLSGPKIRTGRLEGGKAIPLTPGEPLLLAIGDEVGGPGRVFTTYAELALKLGAGDRLLLDDGKVELEVVSSSPKEIHTRVVSGGELGERKGINAPGVPLRSELTEKDERDLRFGLALGVDIVALSFVQSAGDITRVKAIMAEEGRPLTPVVAKLERPEAIERLDEILDAADAVMVARGDLGLELPLERVPAVQKDVLRRARTRGVPVIVATQVLESMRTEPRPTRAEVSDAAGAVDAGADAIMLSGETATGLYPVRTVKVLHDIIVEAEAAPPDWRTPFVPAALDGHVAALNEAAVHVARHTRAHAIVAITRVGQTAKMLSAVRPDAVIVAATPTAEIARCLNLCRGVVPMVCNVDGELDQVVTRAVEAAVSLTGAPENAIMVVVNTTSDLDRGASNFVRIRRA